MWVLLSFLTAVFTSVQDILAKHLSGRVDRYVIAWSWTFFALPFLALALPFETMRVVQPGFWPALAVSTITLVFGSLFLFRSIELSDLSLTLPILNFTPLFMVITAPLILGEFPTTHGLFGILLIISGSYLLFFRFGQEDLLSPFRRMFQAKGSRYMLIVALLFSIGGNMDKVGVRNSSPLVWSFVLFAVVSLILGVIMKARVKDAARQVRENRAGLILIGAAVALVMIFQMHALQLTLAPYVIAVKRTSVVMSSLWGVWFLKETGGAQRVLAALVMISGVFVIAFGG